MASVHFFSENICWDNPILNTGMLYKIISFNKNVHSLINKSFTHGLDPLLENQCWDNPILNTGECYIKSYPLTKMFRARSNNPLLMASIQFWKSPFLRRSNFEYRKWYKENSFKTNNAHSFIKRKRLQTKPDTSIDTAVTIL